MKAALIIALATVVVALPQDTAAVPDAPITDMNGATLTFSPQEATGVASIAAPDSAPVNQIADGQPQAGNIEAPPPAPLNQIGDGQVQNQVNPPPAKPATNETAPPPLAPPALGGAQRICAGAAGLVMAVAAALMM